MPALTLSRATAHNNTQTMQLLSQSVTPRTDPRVALKQLGPWSTRALWLADEQQGANTGAKDGSIIQWAQPNQTRGEDIVWGAGGVQ